MTLSMTAGATGVQANWALRLCIALLGLLILRLTGVWFAGTDLFFDEAQYWAWSLEPAFGYFSKPPLIAWVIGAATSVCGDSEACLRAPSAIIHSLTSLAVFAIARQLYDERTGFFAGLGFATLPGISLSSGIISTDVPLLLFWTIALFAWIRLVETHRKGWAVALGAAIGLGMLSKYAMAYFLLCAVIHAAVSPRARQAMVSWNMLLALLIAGAILAPNILWNLENGLATVKHTADNANLEAAWFRPGKAAEFFAGQFGVMGPILFGALIWLTWRAIRGGFADERQRLLLSFSIPLILLVTCVAFLSRAHANWAAAAYPAATVLVTAALLDARPFLLKFSLGLHVLIAAAIPAAVAAAPWLNPPGGVNPFARTLGWDESARAVFREAENNGAKAIVSDDRAVTAELIYYGRHNPTPVFAMPTGRAPRDHFELTRGLPNTAPSPMLYVTPHDRVARIEGAFKSVDALGAREIETGRGAMRRLHLYLVEAFRGGGSQ